MDFFGYLHEQVVGLLVVLVGRVRVPFQLVEKSGFELGPIR
jgi:hypothetical protein